jgi:hypothetical protein
MLIREHVSFCWNRFRFVDILIRLTIDILRDLSRNTRRSIKTFLEITDSRCAYQNVSLATTIELRGHAIDGSTIYPTKSQKDGNGKRLSRYDTNSSSTEVTRDLRGI